MSPGVTCPVDKSKIGRVASPSVGIVGIVGFGGIVGCLLLVFSLLSIGINSLGCSSPQRIDTFFYTKRYNFAAGNLAGSLAVRLY